MGQALSAQRLLYLLLTLSLVTLPAAAAFAAETMPGDIRLCFLRVLPDPPRQTIADDVKLLIGWVFDAAAEQRGFRAGEVIDRNSGYAAVAGFAAPTPLIHLSGRYRVLRAPFDLGNGYYGVGFGALDDGDRVVAVLLVNRLFRLPIALHEPIGLATDLITNVAMIAGWNTPALDDAKAAADAAYAEAAAAGVPLLAAGQSQAGGIAELQAAYLQKKHAAGTVAVGFLTMNAAPAMASVTRVGLAPRAVEGINFAKDLDPGVGPHALFANAVGEQIYIHRDGSGGLTPGDNVTAFGAMLHPMQHFLQSFEDVSLSATLTPLLAALPAEPGC